MEYKIEQDETTGIITAHVTGKWTPQQDNEMLARIMSLPSTGAKLVLVDLRQLATNFSVAYVYERAKFLSQRREGVESPSFKAALVYEGSDPKVASAYQFFETTTRNRGLPYRVFADVEQARQWLLEG